MFAVLKSFSINQERIHSMRGRCCLYRFKDKYRYTNRYSVSVRLCANTTTVSSRCSLTVSNKIHFVCQCFMLVYKDLLFAIKICSLHIIITIHPIELISSSQTSDVFIVLKLISSHFAGHIAIYFVIK